MQVRGSSPIWTALDAHRVDMTRVALSRVIVRNMAVQAAGRLQDGRDFSKGANGFVRVFRSQ